MDRIALAAGPLTLTLLPALGGAIGSFALRRGGRVRDLMRPTPPDAADALQTACFPLVPVCNRVREGRFAWDGRDVTLPLHPGERHALHGQGWRGGWTVAAHDAASATLAFAHAPGAWPWAYQAEQTFALDPAGLTLTLRATNRDAAPMPCGLGLHPYFPKPADFKLIAPVAAAWRADDEIMPTHLGPALGRYRFTGRIGRRILDHAFEGWEGRAALVWPSQRIALAIASAAPRLHVYCPADPVICVEPVTNAVDAVNAPPVAWPRLGLRLLAPGEAMALTVRFAPLPL